MYSKIPLNFPFTAFLRALFISSLLVFLFNSATKSTFTGAFELEIYEVLLDSVIKHLPSPVEAQKYRIPKIWGGDIESDFGKDLISCNKNGELAFVITNTVIDPRSGKEVHAGRLFSGTIKPGMEVYLNTDKKKQKIQQVLVLSLIHI